MTEWENARLRHEAALDGKPDKVSSTLRSTHAYCCEADGWRCIHRHTDFMTLRQG
jgi:ketosteroid isomerase-like protein